MLAFMWHCIFTLNFEQKRRALTCLLPDLHCKEVATYEMVF